ncbi:MAG: hypothetical protein M3P49_13400 [Actinomycetota bacterium]|nr:hypothetical protein [Actinomycetota bacterium]
MSFSRGVYGPGEIGDDFGEVRIPIEATDYVFSGKKVHEHVYVNYSGRCVYVTTYELPDGKYRLLRNNPGWGKELTAPVRPSALRVKYPRIARDLGHVEEVRL